MSDDAAEWKTRYEDEVRRGDAFARLIQGALDLFGYGPEEEETMATFTQDFSSSAGFTFDSAKAEFGGGVVRQKDQRPANATFYASYLSGIDGNWGSGVLTGTASGGADVSGGFLDLTGGILKYVAYAAAGNASSQQTGCVRIRVKPNYTGSPLANQEFWLITSAIGGTSNGIQFLHKSTGQITVVIRDPSGNANINYDLGAWAPTSGTVYELELNWDITTGASRVFIDGVQFGDTMPDTETRTITTGDFAIGTNGFGLVPNFYVADVAVFSTVQHTANYTPIGALSETIYVASGVTCPDFLGTVQAFTGFTTTEAGSVRYVVNGKYWDGAAWSASDGTYAQAASAATTNTNIPTLTAADTVTAKLAFTDGATQASVDALSIAYTARASSALMRSILGRRHAPIQSNVT